jgi:hypothetical protein
VYTSALKGRREGGEGFRDESAGEEGEEKTPARGVFLI